MALTLVPFPFGLLGSTSTPSPLSDVGDVTLQSDSDDSGAGDIIFKTGTLERGRFERSTGNLQVGTALGLDPTLGRKVTAAQAHQGLSRVALHSIEATCVGTSDSGPSGPLFGIATAIEDNNAVNNWVISGAVNNGSGLIRVTANGHGVNTGDSVAVYGVTGTVEANGHWIVTKVDANRVDLQASTFVNAYSAGGTLTNRSFYYGALFGLVPSVDRGGLTGTAANGDDVVGVGVFNGGTGRATAGYNVNHNGAFGTDPEYYVGYGIEANAVVGVNMTGTYTYGIDLTAGSYVTGQLILKNNSGVYARNNAGSGDILVLKIGTDDSLTVGPTGSLAAINLDSTTKLNWSLITADNVHFQFSSGANGSKIATAANQKIAFYGLTPVVQPSTTGTATGFTAGGGTTVTDASTFTGAVGSTAYRISDIVKHLKNLGLIAQ